MAHINKDYAHFLIQSVPTLAPKSIAQKVKNITAREVFRRNSEVKQKLWGGAFWSSRYFMSIVGQHGNENVIANYVKNQADDEYKQLHRKEINPNQISLFMD